MPLSSHQPSKDSGLGPGKRNRRSTSDLPSATKEGKKWSFSTAFSNSRKPSNSDGNTFPGGLPSFVDPIIANDLRQLHKYISKIKNAAKNVNHVDSAWDDYVKHRERCFECCKSLITPPLQRRESSVVSPTTLTSPRPEYQRDLSLDTLNLVATDTGSSTQSSGSRVDSSFLLGAHGEQCQKAACEWQSTVELLANTLRTSLQETYNEYGKDATPEGFEKLCMDKPARKNIIYHMRNASISKMMSADLDFFPKYDVRFRNYDEINKDLAKIRSLLGTSGIPQNRTIIERRISPTGDVMLEFANVESEENPVFRFRVASHCLREISSPIFGHMFNAHFRAELDDDTRRSLPSPPTRHVCGDGNEVMLYRMPQTELNTERSLEILLHAAHNHTDRVPRDIQFRQFVAITEACLRYRCISPLELAVECKWLPYWRENATDDMFGEVLLISYVFGLSENFTRLSRIAILSMTDLGASVPHKVKEKIATVRRAKIEQVYEECRRTLNEYLCPMPRTDPISSTDRGYANPLNGLRCPRGDRTCDTQNLGWYIKSLTELGMLPSVLRSPALFQIETPQPQSLLEIVDSLCQITTPPQCHGGVCDFAPAFRAAIKDIYESVSGLTFPRQSTQSHNNGAQGGGYEQLFKIAAKQRYAPGDHHHYRSPTASLGDSGSGNGGYRDDDDVCFFKILSLLDNPQDLRAAAMVNKRFYRSYRRNETGLLAGIGGTKVEETLAVCRQKSVVEAEGTSYGARVLDDGNSDVTLNADDAVPSQEKFKHGQLLVVENKLLAESDVNKYPAGIRKQLVELRLKESEGTGYSSHLLR
ncbi:hypothetical protein E0Z10_g5386 [Xylaria hypoxylon]|uniref:BTB domain-containing protein n=1 Tax=Xylaria hypoxylon TaxID=37992 RepID=A0A4Z0YTK5_9PEZI|nr:hypothetical protein E0Z10_g5386 [Xylaria hypoxylon]